MMVIVEAILVLVIEVSLTSEVGAIITGPQTEVMLTLIVEFMVEILIQVSRITSAIIVVIMIILKRIVLMRV